MSSSAIPFPAALGSAELPGTGATAISPTLDAPPLPSSQDDLDAPLSTLLGKPTQCLVGSTHGGEDARPPEEKEGEVPEEIVRETRVASTSSLASLGFCPILLIHSVNWSLRGQLFMVIVCKCIS